MTAREPSAEDVVARQHSGMSANDDTPSAVEVIAEAHAAHLQRSGPWGECSCAGLGGLRGDDVPWSAEHVAAATLAALGAAGFVVATREQLADAWDEGYGAGQEDEAFWSRGLSTDSDADEHPHANPHREVQP